MTKDSEKVVERKLVDLCNANKGMCIKLLSFHNVGLPDRLCLFPKAKILFVETKTTGEKPRPIQEYMAYKIRKLGFRVETVDSIQGAIDLINEVLSC